ncbi:Rmp1p ASCRUDRAFT_71154 [Ascoidea rubescens DSM 1968]|uniref:RNase MRP protein 1 RNA binding domain-containing protein n=1 Tax=Ascoidea rubescens DSM 1968 TaxID=1344418 RepID=A0A1D2VEV6_9ASCO|nr:hypothetical protein ASCRUDRAFT_71154 [Ascoidea rubescens DSM 1968]ODV60112.1 hypothetical protein ASCRUDRAFT_71154 [Ascoidea rubescens DSM 1968]
METRPFNLPDLLIPAADQKLLISELDILSHIYKRNKNQHSSSNYWSHINIIYRNLRKIINSLSSLNKIINKDSNKDNRKDISKVIHKYNKINDNLINQVLFFKKKLIPSSYIRFHGVINLGQFITLGLTLIAILSRLSHIFNKIPLFKFLSSNSTNLINKVDQINQDNQINQTVNNNDDIGEVLSPNDLQNIKSISHSNISNIPAIPAIPGETVRSRKRKLESVSKSDDIGSKKVKIASSSILPQNSKTPSISSKKDKQKLKKKKSKSKSKNVMDDIFGF